ncbi:transposase [Streptomyces sp. NPDC056721]|uniref:transposase n=1 Tax=Streptomyces sp. NPDC056721 TaxID=3345923 RepID=UPI0036C593FB
MPRRHLCATLAGTHLSAPRRGPGHPRCRPDHVIADKAYSSRGFRAYVRRRGIGHTIPEKTDQKRHRHNRGMRGGRPPACDREVYRRRNTVECCFNTLKPFCGIATRYDKTARQDRHLLRGSGQSGVAPALGKIRLKADPS